MTLPVDDDFNAIPVINVAPMFDPADSGGAQRVAGKIRAAAVDVGFFYITGHNISQDLQQAVYMCSKYFFALPEEFKKSLSIDSAHRGHVGCKQTVLQGARVPDLKQSFDFAYPSTPDHAESLAGKPPVGMNRWPEAETEWLAVIEQYYAQVFELGQRILEGFALALGTRRDFFRDLYKHPLVRARLLHYPPQEAGDTSQYETAPHTDYGCITILWRDDEGSLQVLGRSGQWGDASYMDGTFVVNIGDMLARWSNDLFVSTPHRVVNDSGQERYSIPVFYDPDFDTVAECLPNCAALGHPAQYGRIVAGEYITAKYDASCAYRKAPG